MTKQDLAAYMQSREYLVGVLGLIFYLRWNYDEAAGGVGQALADASRFLCIWEERSKTK